MLRYKHFSGSGEMLEQTVNSWLEDFEPDVTKMSQTVAADGTLNISFLFEESFRGQERRLSSESGMEAAARPSMSANNLKDEPIQVSIDSMAPPGDRT